MLNRRSARAFLAPLAIAVGLFGTTGCGMGPGDHVFYRVRVDPSVKDAGCYQNNMVPNGVKDDTTNLGGSDTLILYIIAGDTAELDTGSLVIPGKKSDTGYSFAGQAINVEYPIDGIKTTETTKINLVLNIAGDTVDGKTTTITSNKCEGTLCPANFDTSTCTETQTFKGVEINDAEVVVGTAQAPTP